MWFIIIAIICFFLVLSFFLIHIENKKKLELKNIKDNLSNFFKDEYNHLKEIIESDLIPNYENTIIKEVVITYTNINLLIHKDQFNKALKEHKNASKFIKNSDFFIKDINKNEHVINKDLFESLKIKEIESQKLIQIYYKKNHNYESYKSFFIVKLLLKIKSYF